MAGSGSMPLPCPDLLAGKSGRSLAIECKSGKNTRYITKEQIQQLLTFSKGFGAEALLGIRFNSMDWYFLKPKDLGKSKSGKNFFISKELAIEKGINFEDLIK